MPFVNNFTQGRGRIVAAGTLDAEVISDTMDIRGLHQMSLFVDLVRGGGVVNVVMSLDCSFDGADWMPIQDQAQTPPDKALVDATWTKATPTSLKWMFDIAVSGRLGAPFLRARFNDSSGGTVDDVLTVDAYAEA